LTPERRAARSLAFRRWRDKQVALGLVRLRVFVPAEDAARLRRLLETRTAVYLAERDENARVEHSSAGGDGMETVVSTVAAVDTDMIETVGADASSGTPLARVPNALGTARKTTAALP